MTLDELNPPLTHLMRVILDQPKPDNTSVKDCASFVATCLMVFGYGDDVARSVISDPRNEFFPIAPEDDAAVVLYKIIRDALYNVQSLKRGPDA